MMCRNPPKGHRKSFIDHHHGTTIENDPIGAADELRLLVVFEGERKGVQVLPAEPEDFPARLQLLILEDPPDAFALHLEPFTNPGRQSLREDMRDGVHVECPGIAASDQYFTLHNRTLWIRLEPAVLLTGKTSVLANAPYLDGLHGKGLDEAGHRSVDGQQGPLKRGEHPKVHLIKLTPAGEGTPRGPFQRVENVFTGHGEWGLGGTCSSWTGS